MIGFRSLSSSTNTVCSVVSLHIASASWTVFKFGLKLQYYRSALLETRQMVFYHFEHIDDAILFMFREIITFQIFCIVSYKKLLELSCLLKSFSCLELFQPTERCNIPVRFAKEWLLKEEPRPRPRLTARENSNSACMTFN